jgi:DNA polymerase I-like protein with 3'-5' exonuclease and polymerase domains
MKIIVLDSESDGLWKEATKLHVVAWTDDGETYHHTNDYEVMKSLLLEEDTRIVAHNSIRHDLPTFNKILGLNLNHTKFIDSLALSWYVNFERDKHGLEGYGIEYGVPKPKVEDWSSLSYEEYTHRCVEDVKINWRLWKDLERKLLKLYGNWDEAVRIVDYLGFKMDCAREAEEVGVRLDVERAQKNYDELERLQQEKFEELVKAMPKQPVYKTFKKPAQQVKKDGTMTEAWKKWLNILFQSELPSNFEGDTVEMVVDWEDANPNSDAQVKDWLYRLGWEPQTWKYDKNKQTGVEKRIAQVRYPATHAEGGQLCASVTSLKDKAPGVEILEGLTVIRHRKGFFKAMLDSHTDGWLVASVAGLTNTFRFKHAKPLANIPKVDKPWGAEIRGCLIAPDGFDLVGSDMVSLEDTTKRHYMKPYDPAYVAEMSLPGFDPHLNLAEFAGAITAEDAAKHARGEINLKPIRSKYKAANYSCVYGVGAAKLAREIGVTPKEATAIIKAYWERNHSVVKATESFKVKLVGNSMWLQNPVSKFWHNLRSEKDRFSTANQSTGVYCFDTWLSFCRKAGIKIAMQFHDEVGFYVKEQVTEYIADILKGSIKKTNDKLKLNVLLDVDVQIGKNYAETH